MKIRKIDHSITVIAVFALFWEGIGTQWSTVCAQWATLFRSDFEEFFTMMGNFSTPTVMALIAIAAIGIAAVLEDALYLEFRFFKSIVYNFCRDCKRIYANLRNLHNTITGWFNKANL